LLHELSYIPKASAHIELLDCPGEKLLIECYIEKESLKYLFKPLKINTKNLYKKVIGEQRGELEDARFKHALQLRFFKAPQEIRDLIQKYESELIERQKW
jgi:hypothetical protein